jgi:hypothetical protein
MIEIYKSNNVMKTIVPHNYLENQPLNKVQESLEALYENMGMKEHAEEHKKERLKRIEERYRNYIRLVEDPMGNINEAFSRIKGHDMDGTKDCEPLILDDYRDLFTDEEWKRIIKLHKKGEK